MISSCAISFLKISHSPSFSQVIFAEVHDVRDDFISFEIMSAFAEEA